MSLQSYDDKRLVQCVFDLLNMKKDFLRNRFYLLFFLCASSASTESTASNGLCSKTETPFFVCQTSNGRLISLCEVQPNFVQYRYGTNKRIELNYPKSKKEGDLLYAQYSRYQSDKYEVSFDKNGVTYSVFDYTEGKNKISGVRVTLEDGTEREIICKKVIASRMNELKKILPCDSDNALNGGICN